MDELAISAVESFDDIVGNSLTPALPSPTTNINDNEQCFKGPERSNISEGSTVQDPDKIFRTYPSFDPVFMKV